MRRCRLIARELTCMRAAATGIAALHRADRGGGEAMVVAGRDLCARRRTRGADRAHHRRGQRRPLRSGAAEARPGRLDYAVRRLGGGSVGGGGSATSVVGPAPALAASGSPSGSRRAGGSSLTAFSIGGSGLARLIFLARQRPRLLGHRRRRLVHRRLGARVDAGVEPVAGDHADPRRDRCCHSGG